ncbi:flavin reductase [Pseudochelatococcus sp. B33]
MESPLNHEVRAVQASSSDAEPIDPRAFRQCLGQFATGVTVITTLTDGRPVGVTANSFSSLSLDPPLVLWSIGRKSRSFHAFEAAEHFAINILAADQVDVSQRFSSAAEDKFEGFTWSAGHAGLPLIPGAIAHLECSAAAAHQEGDHILLIGRVLRFVSMSGSPLLFAQGRYGVVEEHPAVKATRESASAANEAVPQETRLLSLLFKAHRLASANFDRHRKAEGMTAAHVRILAELYDRPRLTAELLSRRAYMGRRELDDAVADLVERGWVSRLPDGALELTAAGRSKRETIRRLRDEFDASQFAGVPETERACARDFLSKLIERQARELEQQ